MKLKRIMALLQCVFIIPAMMVFASEQIPQSGSEEIITADATTVTVPGATETEDIIVVSSDDSYVASGSKWENKNYGDDAIMYFGKAYQRTAYLKFDISGIDLTDYSGALLELNFSTSKSGGKVEVYTASADWSEKNITWKNAPKDMEFVVILNVSELGDQSHKISLNKALERAKANGEQEIAVVLKSDLPCVSAFTSEASNSALRPKLILTEDSAFVKGQYDFEFPDISVAEFKKELESTIAKGHPYMIASKERFQKIREYAFGKDKVLTEHYARIKQIATERISQMPIMITEDISSNSYIGKAIQYWEDIMKFALIYNVEGDKKYAEAAWKQVEYICKLDNWGTYQMIDNVQTMYAVALCYDWLYDWLSEDKKDLIVKAMRDNHFDEMSDLYHNPTKEEYRWSFHQASFADNNHSLMDNSLTFLGALVLAENDIDFFADVMYQTHELLKAPLARWYPDSAWFEGIGYWSYAGPYTIRWILSMQTAFGHSFGYDKVNCLINAADFPIYAQSNKLGGFVWNDIGLSADQRVPIIYAFGYLKDDISLQTYSLNNAGVNTGADPIFCLLYDPTKSYDVELDLSLDKFFRNQDVVFMRNTFEGMQENWVAFAVQETNANLGMMNSGTVGFDALGERWICNHGRESYYDDYWNFNKERWTYYRTRAESQSCIVINPSTYGGQAVDSKDIINEFDTGDGSSFAWSDLTDTYRGQAKDYKRGVKLTNDRKTFVIQDELKLTEPSEVYSFYNIYKADVEILSDGKSAIVTKNNKKMYVTVDCDAEYTFDVMYSEPLPTSPTPVYPNSPNFDFLKLFIHFDNIEQADFRICFTPYLDEEELECIEYEPFTPIADWKVDETIKTLPVLTGIKIDGVSVSEFNPANRCYDVDVLPTNVEALADANLYETEVKKDENSFTIVVRDKYDKSNINTYSLAVPAVPTPSYVDITGMNEIKIEKTEAPEPQEDNNINNLYDNDLSTRWSAQGMGTEMTLTLDSSRILGALAIALYEGSTNRVQYFDVQLSENGVDWVDAGKFSTSGVTDDYEYFDLKKTKAKYVKIIYNTCNISDWNSVCELRLYGK